MLESYPSHLVSFITMKQKVSVLALALLILCSFRFFSDQSLAVQQEGDKQGPQRSVTSTETPKEPGVVTLRVGRHADFIRAVFVAGEEYIQKSSVTQTGDTIKVEFPYPFVISHSEKGPLTDDVPLEIGKGIRVVTKGGVCRLTLEGLTNIKISKFSSPSRLVVDGYVRPPLQGSLGDESIPPRPAEEPGRELKSVVIDAGHGGYDKGIQGADFTEKDMALSFAKELASALNRKGKKVFLTRKSDQVLSIKERIKIAHQKSPDIVISIHLSSGSDFAVFSPQRKADKSGQDNWSETGRQPTADAAIARAIIQNIAGSPDLITVHEKLPLPLLSQVAAPALLIEIPHPEKIKYDAKTRERFISAVVKGLGHSSPAPKVDSRL